MYTTRDYGNFQVLRYSMLQYTNFWTVHRTNLNGGCFEIVSTSWATLLKIWKSYLLPFAQYGTLQWLLAHPVLAKMCIFHCFRYFTLHQCAVPSLVWHKSFWLLRPLIWTIIHLTVICSCRYIGQNKNFPTVLGNPRCTTQYRYWYAKQCYGSSELSFDTSLTYITVICSCWDIG